MLQAALDKDKNRHVGEFVHDYYGVGKSVDAMLVSAQLEIKLHEAVTAAERENKAHKANCIRLFMQRNRVSRSNSEQTCNTAMNFHNRDILWKNQSKMQSREYTKEAVMSLCRRIDQLTADTDDEFESDEDDEEDQICDEVHLKKKTSFWNMCVKHNEKMVFARNLFTDTLEAIYNFVEQNYNEEMSCPSVKFLDAEKREKSVAEEFSKIMACIEDSDAYDPYAVVNCHANVWVGPTELGSHSDTMCSNTSDTPTPGSSQRGWTPNDINVGASTSKVTETNETEAVVVEPKTKKIKKTGVQKRKYKKKATNKTFSPQPFTPHRYFTRLAYKQSLCLLRSASHKPLLSNYRKMSL